MPTTPTTITAEQGSDSFRIYRRKGRLMMPIGAVFYLKRPRGGFGWIAQPSLYRRQQYDKTPEAAAMRRWGAAARDAVKAAAAPKNPTADLASINVWAP